MMIGMMRIIFVVMICMPLAAHAACDIGYYLSDGECVRCTSGYYCPDENTEIKCPEDTNDWRAIFTERGYEVKSAVMTRYYSWASSGNPAYSIEHCHLGMNVETSVGRFYMEPRFNGVGYNSYSMLWTSAKTGYYLSPYSWTSSANWYGGVKPCTNAPENAHYAGAGTPDEPKSGGATDYNDCPWECDDGYGLHGDVCVPLCGGGIQYIKTGGGLQFNLYSVAYSSPALAVRNGTIICYGVLGQGTSKNAINVNVAGKIYHTEN